MPDVASMLSLSAFVVDASSLGDDSRSADLGGVDLSGNKGLASEDTIFSRDLYSALVSSRGLELLYGAIEMQPTNLSHISPCQVAGRGPSRSS